MTAALLIIDVQKGLFMPPPADADAVIDRINMLSAAARQAQVPVIFIQHQTADDELAHGSDAWQVDPRLQQVAGDLRVEKTTPDSFLRTNLQALLQQHGVTQLVICGYSTEYCVDSTTRRAAGHGYPVVLAADAHTSHDKAHASGEWIRQHHNAALSSMESFGVPIRAVASRDIRF
ncbi:cysteine hydrolase family protein [Serratia odorifera]|jgi:nicotinamidase-related amidase|nr:cysteine hydrolase family protein [Serratia odorifera]MBJ2064192.1 cysteine hydrolase [Serratia odorifera]PNK88554.1 cysteine hydrolase [Serratia odorifera]RII69651.1 cysteine hydrolase [Serratia odorifera]VDZ65556.1 Isochorismatase family protein yecD [Serratia odorifera]